MDIRNELVVGYEQHTYEDLKAVIEEEIRALNVRYISGFEVYKDIEIISNEISDEFNSLIKYDTLEQGYEGFLDGIKNFFKKIWEFILKIVDFIITTIKRLIDFIKNMFSSSSGGGGGSSNRSIDDTMDEVQNAIREHIKQAEKSAQKSDNKISEKLLNDIKGIFKKYPMLLFYYQIGKTKTLKESMKKMLVNLSDHSRVTSVLMFYHIAISITSENAINNINAILDSIKDVINKTDNVNLKDYFADNKTVYSYLVMLNNNFITMGETGIKYIDILKTIVSKSEDENIIIGIRKTSVRYINSDSLKNMTYDKKKFEELKNKLEEANKLLLSNNKNDTIGIDTYIGLLNDIKSYILDLSSKLNIVLNTKNLEFKDEYVDIIKEEFKSDIDYYELTNEALNITIGKTSSETVNMAEFTKKQGIVIKNEEFKKLISKDIKKVTAKDIEDFVKSYTKDLLVEKKKVEEIKKKATNIKKDLDSKLVEMLKDENKKDSVDKLNALYRDFSKLISIYLSILGNVVSKNYSSSIRYLLMLKQRIDLINRLWFDLLPHSF